MRIAFFGLPLAALLLARDGFVPELAVLSPVEAPGRRRLSRRLGARVVDARGQSERDCRAEVDRRLLAVKPDLIVSWYFTRKLPAHWLQAAPLGAIGAHPSLLPRHRGPDPFYWAIDSGDRTTGVSIHYLVEEYDAGDVLLREELEIGDLTAWQLARALDRPSLRLLRQVVGQFARGTPPPRTRQDEALATWAPAPSGDELRVDFRWPTERVLRRFRALSPVPGVALEIRGIELTVTRVLPTDDYPRTLLPGEAARSGAGVVIRTGDGAVRLVAAALEDPERVAVEELAFEAIARRVFGAGGRSAT